jgi:hypothetical protein
VGSKESTKIHEVGVLISKKKSSYTYTTHTLLKGVNTVCTASATKDAPEKESERELLRVL